MKKIPLLALALQLCSLASPSPMDQARNLARSRNWKALGACLAQARVQVNESEKTVLDFLAGYALQKEGEDQEAVEPLLRAGEANSPLSDYALYQLGLGLKNLGKKDEAEQALKKISNAGYVYIPGRLLLARIYIETNRADEAGTELALLKEKRLPGWLMPELALLEARVLLGQGKTELALQKLAWLWINYPGSDAARELESAPELTAEQVLARSSRLMQDRVWLKARQELEALLADKDRSAPVISELLGSLARARFYGRDYRSVVRLEPEARKSAPENPEFWFYLAWSYHRLDKEDQARKIYLKAAYKFKDSPYSARSLYNLARMEQDKEHFWLAHQYFQELIRSHPESELAEDAAFESGLIAFEQKKYPGAVSIFRAGQAGAKDPARFQYWLYQSLSKDGRASDAEMARTELLKHFPASAYAFLADPCPSPEIIARKNVQLFPAALPDNYKPGLLLAWAGLYELSERELRWQTENSRPSNDDLLFMVNQLEEFQAYPLAFLVFWDALAPRLNSEDQLAYYQYLYPLAFSDLVQAKAEKYGLEPALAYALLRQESAFNPGATSSAGAMGLAQLMPSLAQKTAQTLGSEINGPDGFFAPELNLEIGFYHLSRLRENYREAGPEPWPMLLAIAAYNAGTKPVDKWFEQTKKNGSSPDLWIEQISFAETRSYEKKVLANLRIYRALLQEQNRSCP